MYRHQRFALGIAAALLALPVTAATGALAQNAPLSYAVPDPGAWSDVLKSASKKNVAPAKKAERRKAKPSRQAKARPPTSDSKAEAREAFASAPPNPAARAADVRVVSPDEYNEIDRMAAGQ